MAGYIRVSPDRMRERASQMRREAERMGQVVARMDNLQRALQSEWEGYGCESFSARYQELRPGFLKMEDYIQELAGGLEFYAARFEELDASLA